MSSSKKQHFPKPVQVNLSLSDDQVDQFYEVFLNHRGRNGKLRLNKLIQIFQEFDIPASQQQKSAFLSKLELQDGAYLTFPEFTHMLARKMLEAEIEDEIKQLYRVFDVENKGYVTAKDLKTVLITLNPRITDDDVEEIIMDADTDQDGVLVYEEFVYMCLPK